MCKKGRSLRIGGLLKYTQNVPPSYNVLLTPNVFFPNSRETWSPKAGVCYPGVPTFSTIEKMPINQICQRQPLACVIRLAELPRFGSGGMLELAACFFNKALLIDQFSIYSWHGW